MEDSIHSPSFETEEYVAPKLKSCDLCIHKGVCGAYNQFPSIREKFEQRYQYVGEFPAKAIALAIMCKEYREAAPGEQVNEYECAGCSDRDGM